MEPSSFDKRADAVDGDDLLEALSAIEKLRQEALYAIARLKAEVDEQEQALVGMARRGGHTWGEIAKALGLNSRQAAHYRYREKR